MPEKDGVPGRQILSRTERYCRDCPAYDGTPVTVENLRTWCRVSNLLEEGRFREALSIGLEVGKKKDVNGCSSLLDVSRVMEEAQRRSLPPEVIAKVRAIEAGSGGLLKETGINPPGVDESFIQEGLRGAKEISGGRSPSLREILDERGQVYKVFFDSLC